MAHTRGEKWALPKISSWSVHFTFEKRISSPLEMGTLVVYPTNCERCEASATRVYFSLKRS